MEFARQEYWSGLPFPSPVDLPNPGIKPGSPASQADTLPSELAGKPQTTKTLQTIIYLSVLFDNDHTYSVQSIRDLKQIYISQIIHHITYT